MREVAVLAIMLILSSCALQTTATMPRLPTLTVSLSPATANIVSNATGSVPVQFNGTVSVQTGMFDRNTYEVGLTSSTDTGWQSVASPVQMTFSGSGSQDFFCFVEVPPATGNVTATVTVEARLHGGAFAVVSTDTSQLVVENLTTERTLSRSGSATGGHSMGAGELILIAAVPLIAAAVGVWIYLIYIGKRRSQ